MKRALILSGGGARGAFQVGVWKYLQHMGWQPDMICGSSIGAINAAAIGSGMDVEQLTRLWTHHNRRRIYRLQLLDFISNALLRRRFVPLLNATPLKTVLREVIDFKALKRSRQEIIVSAVNLYTSAPEFFNQNEITIDHLLASSAMPIIFPWHMIDGIPYWDGGIMANIPLLPALARGMDEIIVVQLSPVGSTMLPEPHRLKDAGEHLMEQFLFASYHTTLMGHGLLSCQSHLVDPRYPQKENCNQEKQHLNSAEDHGGGGVTDMLPPSAYLRKKQQPCTERGRRNLSLSGSGEPRIIMVTPSRMLGLGSLLKVSRKQAENLINHGYENARCRLKDIV